MSPLGAAWLLTIGFGMTSAGLVRAEMLPSAPWTLAELLARYGSRPLKRLHGTSA